MKKSIWYKLLIIGLAILAGAGILYYFTGAPSLSTTVYTEDYADPNISIGAVQNNNDSDVITQQFLVNGTEFQGVEIFFGKGADTVPEGYVNVKVENQSGDVIINSSLPANQLEYLTYTKFYTGELLQVESGSMFLLTITFKDCTPATSPFVWVNPKAEGMPMLVNGKPFDGMVNMSVAEYVSSNFPFWHWAIICALAALLTAFCLYQVRCQKKGKINAANEFVHIFDKYKFLLRQLVGRDFKNKYRRSYLGVLWSLISPLLMMIIVSAVFSFIFRFNIENFPVYLIIGQTMFNFFTEATSSALASVTTSGQLIKKVYMPKYIFPLSKVMFAFVNMMFTFIPVILVMLYYRIKITYTVAYFPVFIVSFFVFTLGIGLLLSAMQVFMRDTQHLYSIVVTMLSYVTPIFYPVSTLSPWMITIIKFNPIYHYVSYLRNIFFYGVCPSVLDHVVCIGAALVSITIGMLFFYKRQNKFILYI